MWRLITKPSQGITCAIGKSAQLECYYRREIWSTLLDIVWEIHLNNFSLNCRRIHLNLIYKLRETEFHSFFKTRIFSMSWSETEPKHGIRVKTFVRFICKTNIFQLLSLSYRLNWNWMAKNSLNGWIVFEFRDTWLRVVGLVSDFDHDWHWHE